MPTLPSKKIASGDRRLVEIGPKGEGEVKDFNRRQTDAGVLMLFKTSKLMAELCRSPSAALGKLGRITPAFPVGRVRR
jgi:hypothetical protein